VLKNKASIWLIAIVLLFSSFHLNGATAKTSQESVSEPQVDEQLKVTLAGQDTFAFHGKGVYTIDYQDEGIDLSIDSEERDVLYTMILPVGVELPEDRGFWGASVKEYDEDTRTITLKSPDTPYDLFGIGLDFDLEEDVELVVMRKQADDVIVKSLPLAITILAEEEEVPSAVQDPETNEEIILPIAPAVRSDDEYIANPAGIAPTLGGIAINDWSRDADGVRNNILNLVPRDDGQTGQKALVYNWIDLFAAMSNNNVTHIELQNHVMIPDTSIADPTTGSTSTSLTTRAGGYRPSGDVPSWTGITGAHTDNGTGFIRFTRNAMTAANPLIIDGQGKYILDVGRTELGYSNNTAKHIVFKGLSAYSGNAYGFFTFRGQDTATQGASSIIYENFIHQGTQVMHATNTNIRMRGYVSAVQDDDGYYYSPIRRNTNDTIRPWSYNHRANNHMECNFFVNDLQVEPHSQVYLYSSSAGNLHVQGGTVTIGEGAAMYLNSSFNLQRRNNINGSLESGGTGSGNTGTGGSTEGYNLLIQQTGSSLTLYDQSRLFLYGNETKHSHGLLRMRPASTNNGPRIHVGRGAALELYQTGKTGTTINTGGEGPTVDLFGGAQITVVDYGRFSIYADRMVGGTSPLRFRGAATFNIGRNGIFDLVADTTQPLIYSAGITIVDFIDAYRVNIQRPGNVGLGRTNGLIGAASGASTAVDGLNQNRVELRVQNQEIRQWDDTHASTILNVVPTVENDFMQYGLHHPTVPTQNIAPLRNHTGFSNELQAVTGLVTNLTYDTIDDDWTQRWKPVYRVDLRFTQGSNVNATSHNVRTLKSGDVINIPQQLGRSSTATGTANSTTGSKPNRLLFTKIYEAEVYLFSELTDDPSATSRTYEGSVTRSYISDNETKYVIADDGFYEQREVTRNPQQLKIDYDPRREIVGRIGAANNIYMYDSSKRTMVLTSEFIPFENVSVRIEENGSIHPVTNVYNASGFNGSVKPAQDETIELEGLQVSELAEMAPNFADQKYTLRSSGESGAETTRGTSLPGKGWFVYTLPDDGLYVAEDLVKISSFDEEAGSYFEYGDILPRQDLKSIHVKDETAPTAKPRYGAGDKENAMLLNFSSTGKLPDPSFFVELEKDTNPYAPKYGDHEYESVRDYVQRGSSFYRYEYNYASSSSILDVKSIENEAHFRDVISDITIDETQYFSIGVNVYDPAGNFVKVETVFFRIVDNQFDVLLNDLYIYESTFQQLESLVSKNLTSLTLEELVKSWLVQNGIENIHYTVRDEEGVAIVDEHYQPSALTYLTDEALFDVNLGALLSERQVGKVYPIHAVLLADQANPGKDPNSGIFKDYHVEPFSVKIIEDRMEILDVKDIDFGIHRITGASGDLSSPMEKMIELTVVDEIGRFDLSAAKEIDSPLLFDLNGSVVMLRIGKLADVNDIKTYEEVTETWKVSAQMTKPFTEEPLGFFGGLSNFLNPKAGKQLPATINFKKGRLVSLESDIESEFSIEKMLYFGGPSVELVDASKVGERDHMKGRQQIIFQPDDVKLNVLASDKQLGTYVAEITYTMAAVPNE